MERCYAAPRRGHRPPPRKCPQMRSSRPDLAELLVRRSALLRRHPNARVFLLHFDREYIDAADGVSKADVDEDGHTGLYRANRTLAARGMGRLTTANRL